MGKMDINSGEEVMNWLAHLDVMLFIVVFYPIAVEYLLLENVWMNLVFEMEHVICSPNADYNLCRPIANVTGIYAMVKVKQGSPYNNLD